MKKLRIAVWHNLPSGGGKRQLYIHVKGLLERGHYVESWCPDTADQKFLPLSSLVKEHVIPLREKQDNYNNPLRPYRTTKQLLRVMENHCLECASEMEAGGFDILFANACMYLRTTPIAKFATFPSAIYLGEPYRWFYEATSELPWISPLKFYANDFSISQIKEYIKNLVVIGSMRLQARAELEYAKYFDHILCNSIYSRESILKAYDIDSKVCYLGIDAEYYKPTGEPKEDFLLGLGSIYHGKGVDRAIKAIAAINADKRPKLVWVGNFASEEDMNNFKEMAIKFNVDFITKINISDEEVVSLLSRARAMVYTSRLEPFGLAPLEANACCTPAVAIAEGGVKETIKDGLNGYLALNDDPAVLAELLEKVIDDSCTGNKMGQNSREYVKSTWNMQMCIDNIENALIQLHGKKRIKKVLQKKSLQDLKPTDDLRMCIENYELKSKRLALRGWAFIDDGKGSADSTIILVVTTNAGVHTLHTNKVKRKDVTSFFGNTVDNDDSGFILDCPMSCKSPKMGILVIRDEKFSFQYF